MKAESIKEEYVLNLTITKIETISYTDDNNFNRTVTPPTIKQESTEMTKIVHKDRDSWRLRRKTIELLQAIMNGDEPTSGISG